MNWVFAHPTAAALVAICGADDRLIGWGGWGRAKPVALAVLGLAGIAFWMGLKPASIATLPIAFLIWRTPGWGLLGGSINPAPGRAIYTFFRHSLAFAFLAPAYWSGLRLIPVGVSILGFVLAATLLAMINFFSSAKENGVIEFIRGCALGAALAAGFILLQ